MYALCKHVPSGSLLRSTEGYVATLDWMESEELETLPNDTFRTGGLATLLGEKGLDSWRASVALATLEAGTWVGSEGVCSLRVVAALCVSPNRVDFRLLLRMTSCSVLVASSGAASMGASVTILVTCHHRATDKVTISSK